LGKPGEGAKWVATSERVSFTRALGELTGRLDGGEHGLRALAPGGGGNGGGRLGAGARRDARALNRPGRRIVVTTGVDGENPST
jgi:hypothetical protein